MKDEATTNAETDKKERERVDKLNAADGLIFQTEKQLKEYGDKLPADKKSEIEAALEQLKNAHKNQDVTAVDAAMTKLNGIWQTASEQMYNNTEAQGGEQAPQGDPSASSNTGKSGDDEVTDVDFEEVDDKK